MMKWIRDQLGLTKLQNDIDEMKKEIVEIKISTKPEDITWAASCMPYSNTYYDIGTFKNNLKR